MPVPIEHTLGMLSDNLRKRASALPLSRRRSTAWARGLGLRRGGPTVLYTGQMFQMVPAINAMSRRLAEAEGSWMSRYFGVARRLNRWVNLTAVMARGDPAETREYDASLRRIAGLLKAAGIEFGYLYEEDLYAGALAHDEGLDATFRPHAKRIQAILRANGVERLITVDPHTTNVLRSVMPRLLPDFHVRVESYLEVLAAARRGPPQPAQNGHAVTIHDSCIYARREGVVEAPRMLLRDRGIEIREAEFSGRATQCCGGPLETLFPGKAQAVAARRIAQLAKCSNEVATLCPLCLASLRRVAPAGVAVRDIASYLAPEEGVDASVSGPGTAVAASSV